LGLDEVGGCSGAWAVERSRDFGAGDICSGKPKGGRARAGDGASGYAFCDDRKRSRWQAFCGKEAETEAEADRARRGVEGGALGHGVSLDRRIGVLGAEAARSGELQNGLERIWECSV